MGISRDNRTLTLLHHVLVTWLPSLPPKQKKTSWFPLNGSGGMTGKLGKKSGHISANPRSRGTLEPAEAYNGEYVSYYVRETRVPLFGPLFLQYGFVVLNRIFHFWHIKTSRKMWTNGVPRGARVVDNSFWWSAGDQEFSKIESSFENPPCCVSQRRSFHFLLPQGFQKISTSTSQQFWAVHIFFLSCFKYHPVN